MGNTPKGTVRHARPDTTVEQPDEMIHIVRGSSGEIMDAGIDEFVELERMSTNYFKLTLTGKDENNPVVLVLRSESKITVREFGTKDQPGEEG
jgi:hypothetical protein